MFTSQPQAVEVYQAGAWWAGELLGWRHDAAGSCQVWVRVVLGGVEETAWTDLTSLRLPERHLAVAADPTARGSRVAGTQEMSVSRHPAGRRARAADADGATTSGPFTVRDLSAVPELRSTGGRRTAEETAQFASVGRRRAPEAPVAGGRRTADETAQFASVGRRRAPEDGAPRVRPVVPPGRHRAADTGLLPVVSEQVVPASESGASVAPRCAVPLREASGRSSASWTVPQGLEPELLTRPMRLSDHAPHARRPRVDGPARGV